MKNENLKTICPFCNEEKGFLFQLPLTIWLNKDSAQYTREKTSDFKSVICNDCLTLEIDKTL